MKIALGQIDISPEDLEVNIQRHIEQVNAALQEDADLIVFPEMSLSGDGTRGNVEHMALRADDERLADLRALSQKIDIVAGMLEEAGPSRYNSAVCWHNGEIAHRHRKVFLATYASFFEDEFCQPGDVVDAFSLPQGRVSMLVCNDLWHPLLPYMSALHGAELLLGPSNSAWSAMGDQLKIAATWENMNRAFAGSLGVYVVFVNRVGPRHVDGKDLQYWGGSEIIAPSGEVVAKAPYNDTALLVAEIDLARARHQQADAHIFRDFDPQRMREEFERAVSAMAARRKT